MSNKYIKTSTFKRSKHKLRTNRFNETTKKPRERESELLMFV